MPLIPFFSSNRKISRWRALAVTLLLLYLLLFSIFALFHAYAAGELDGSHVCTIGQWIHLSLQAAVLFFFVVTPAWLFEIHRATARSFVTTLLRSNPFKRGPPFFLFLPAGV